MIAARSGQPATLMHAVDAADEIPFASAVVPDPTRGDRWLFVSVFVLSICGGWGVAFLLLRALTPILLPPPAYDVVLRAGPDLGAVLGSCFLAIIVGLIVRRWMLRCRFPDDPRARVVFSRMLGGQRKSSRGAAERFADRRGRYDEYSSFIGLTTLYLIGLYTWIAFSTLFMGVGPQAIGWQGFSLLVHERPTSEVRAIYRTSKFIQRSRASRPCVVVQFNDREEIRSEEVFATADACDRLAALLSRASGVSVTPSPWLETVPTPK